MTIKCLQRLAAILREQTQYLFALVMLETHSDRVTVTSHGGTTLPFFCLELFQVGAAFFCPPFSPQVLHI